MDYQEWNHLVQKGDREIWEHLDLMMTGREGGFAQSLRFSMDAADGHNRRRLYEAFPEYFLTRKSAK